MKDLGLQIIVMDAGFIYVGNVKLIDGFIYISNAKNIRTWGTKNGLGELRNGPTKDTVMDFAGEIIAPITRVIHFIKTENWK